MSKCNTYNFNIKRGATKSFTIIYKDSAGEIIPLTGYNARMQLRTEPEAPSADLSLTSEQFTANRSTIHITPESGSLLIYISAGDSDELLNDSYFYDLEIYTDADPFQKDDSEYVVRLVEGIIVMQYNVTRD